MNDFYQHWATEGDPKGLAADEAQKAWEAQQSRIDELEKALEQSMDAFDVLNKSVDAHNKRCDEGCELMSDLGCLEGKRDENGFMCRHCPRHHKIEDTTNE